MANNILDPKTYLPPCYDGVREIDILADAISYMLGHIREELLQVLANNFAQTANEQGVARFERMLGLVSDASIYLETRRKRILSKMTTSTVFTIRVLRNNLIEMCDNGEFTITSDLDNFYMDLKVRIGKKGMLDVLYDLLYTMLPAHIGFYIHNHLPAKSEGGTFFAAATKFRHVYRVVDGITPKGKTTLTALPGATMSVRIEKSVLDAIVETINGSLDMYPAATTATSSIKRVTDSQIQRLKTEQTLRPAMAVVKTHIVKN